MVLVLSETLFWAKLVQFPLQIRWVFSGTHILWYNNSYIYLHSVGLGYLHSIGLGYWMDDESVQSLTPKLFLEIAATFRPGVAIEKACLVMLVGRNIRLIAKLWKNVSAQCIGVVHRLWYLHIYDMICCWRETF